MFAGLTAAAERTALRLSVRAVTVIMTIGAMLFAVTRSWRIGGAGAFVVAGTPFTDPSAVPGGIPVMAGGGFDGQFFYRLASNPRAVGMGRVDGIAFDYEVRGGRIGYPALAWVASLGGRADLLAVAMIVVNIAAVGVLTMIGARLATDHGRAPLWGVAISGYWGFAIVLGRDLAELVAATAVFGAVLLVTRERLVWASLAASAAVLTREQSVLAIAALAIGVFVDRYRQGGGRAAVRAFALVALPPAGCFLAWQALVASVVGTLPAASNSGNTTAPFADLPRSFTGWVDMLRDGSASGLSVGGSLALLCFFALVTLTLAALTSGGVRAAWAARPWEPLVAAAGLTVFACSSGAVLAVPADFRQSYELAGGSWLLLWSAGGRRRRAVLLVVVPVTLLTVAFRCLYV